MGLFVVGIAAIIGQLDTQPTLAAISPVTEPEWLAVANLYRASAGLGPVTENSAATQGAIAHSQYLLQNRVISHGENPGKPGYSAEGVRGGETGNVATGSGAKVGQRETIEGWMTAPFHGLAMIEPNPQPYGYGLAISGTRWASTLSHSWDSYTVPGSSDDTNPLQLAISAVERAHPEVANLSMNATLRGVTIVVNYSGRRFLVVGTTVRELKPGEPPFATVVWPGNASAVPLVRYAGAEWPDPITACAGWTSSAGLPILIHRSVPTSVVAATVTDIGPSGTTAPGTGGAGTNGTPLQICSIDSRTYTNPSAEDQKYVAGLLSDDAILIPKNPLIPGHSYRVQVELAGSDGASGLGSSEVLDWTFGTTTDGSIKLPPGSPMEGRAIPGVPFQPVKSQPPPTNPPTRSTPMPTKSPKKSARTRSFR